MPRQRPTKPATPTLASPPVPDIPHRTTPLSVAIDVFQVRQYFNLIIGGIDLAKTVAGDVGFVDDVRRAAVPLPFDRRSKQNVSFPRRPHTLQPPAGKLAVASTGGSGALASLIGVARAVEDCGGSISLYSLCSGGALFGFPLAMGMSAIEAADLVMGLVPDEYVDVSWSGMARALAQGGRGWAGILRGDRLEEYYRRRLGDATLGDLATPAYAPIWNIEENRLEYLGPRTYPHLPVARAVRMAVSLPLFLQPVPLAGGNWCDGGIVDIFPVHPLLDIEAVPEAVVAVNAFYPAGFAGEDASGWERKSASVVHIARQVRSCQQIELARENLARLRAATDVELLEPVPYWEVRGTGFYRQFLNNASWPDFMLRGYEHMTDALRRRKGTWGAGPAAAVSAIGRRAR